MTTKLAVLAGALVAILAALVVGSKVRRRKANADDPFGVRSGPVNRHGDVESEDRSGVWADDGGAHVGSARATG
jgi:hypothetical protein